MIFIKIALFLALSALKNVENFPPDFCFFTDVPTGIPGISMEENPALTGCGPFRQNPPAPYVFQGAGVQKYFSDSFPFFGLTREGSYGIIIFASSRDPSHGEMSERFKELALKSSDPKGPWVRIPLSPPNFFHRNQLVSDLEKYPSGRRGSPAKGVGRVERREGSNPSFSASKEPQF